MVKAVFGGPGVRRTPIAERGAAPRGGGAGLSGPWKRSRTVSSGSLGRGEGPTGRKGWLPGGGQSQFSKHRALHQAVPPRPATGHGPPQQRRESWLSCTSLEPPGGTLSLRSSPLGEGMGTAGRAAFSSIPFPLFTLESRVTFLMLCPWLETGV